MNTSVKKLFLFGASVLCGTFTLLPASAQAQAYYSDQADSSVPGYHPYYVAQAPAPVAVPAQPQYANQSTLSSTASSSSTSSGRFFAPSGERIVTDPLYLPLHGQIYGTTGYTFNTGSSKTYNSAGAESSNAFTYADTLAQTLAYGITDDLTVRVTESFAVSGTDVDRDITGTTSESNANGFSNPTFGATYRAVDQRNHNPLDLDFSLSYEPDMVAASNGGGGHDGAEASGRQVATFNTAIGREMNGFTFAGIAGAAYNGKKTYEALATSDELTNSSYWNYFVGLDTQTRITDRFSINGDIRYNGYDNYNTNNQTTGISYTAQQADNVDFTLALNYHFIPNRLVGQLSYDNYLYTTNASSNNYVNPLNDTTTSQLGNNVFGVRLLYVFN